MDDNTAQAQNQGLAQELLHLNEMVQNSTVPDEMRTKAVEMLSRLKRMVDTGIYSQEYDRIAHYIDWITSLPWGKYTGDKLDIVAAKEQMEKSHYGMKEPKDRILEYMSVLKLRSSKNLGIARAPIICLVGLVGTGKTTFAKSVAEALGRKFMRIPFGGLSSALDLRGQSKTSPEAEPGMIMRALRRAGTQNPVILLDELDRITPESRAAIMGVLIELLDPGQNNNFTDYFIDFPFDLSQVLFIATANNTNNISTAVMDRLEVIQMPSYTDEEKISIAKNYVFPRYIKEVGLTPENIKIEDSVWMKITRPLGFDSGIRSLERTIEGIARKVAYRIVKGEGTSFVINETNVREYL